MSLNLVGEIGSLRLRKLLAFFDKPENILKASAQKLAAVSGIGENIARKITSLKKEDLEQELASAKKLGLKIITSEDNGYPENLKQIPDPAIVLYIKGELKKEDRLAIGVVGSRKASFYGLTNSEKFAFDLAAAGFTVVSGMAHGVDTYAHKGALKAGGRTIAVMGSGFKHIYPGENRGLAEEISKSGAVISEFPVEALPLKQNFPCRNRVISGLSLGVLVVEAARNSGALITADFALEQGRDVFALPGKVDSGTSFGTNGLIKQGAKLVSCADEVIEEFGCAGLSAANNKKGLHPRAEKANADLDNEDEKRIYGLVTERPIQLDELVEKTRMDISRISGILLRLQLRKTVRQLPGKQFLRA